MNESEKASEAAALLPEDVSSLILQLAQDRIKALQAASAAIDQRITQMAGFQLTAAALAGTFLVNSKDSFLGGAIALAATVAFLTGLSIAIYAVAKGHQEICGMVPRWWHDATKVDDFSIKDARAWMAGHSQFCIESNSKEDERRLRLMKASLAFGAIGGLCVLLSAGAKLTGPNAPQTPPAPTVVTIRSFAPS